MHCKNFYEETAKIAKMLDFSIVERMVDELVSLKKRDGRLFILGVGGSAGNAGHAVNDFRKLCGIETYAPTDNVSELTARTNDEGWTNVFLNWLKTSKLSKNDTLLIFSVGGGDAEKNISVNLINSIDYACSLNCCVIGVVGRDGGHTKKFGSHVVVIPTIDPVHVTPQSESFQAIIWHSIVSHPKLQVNPTTW